MAAYSHGDDSAGFGSLWHHKANSLHRATTLIHEMSHKVSNTGDHVDVINNKMVDSAGAKAAEEKFVEDRNNRIVKEAADREKAISDEKAKQKKIEQSNARQGKQSDKTAQGKAQKAASKEETPSKKAGKQSKAKNDTPAAESGPGKKGKGKEKENATASSSSSSSTHEQNPPKPVITGPVGLSKVPEAVARGAGCKSFVPFQYSPT
jgi:hypothetical protein